MKTFKPHKKSTSVLLTLIFSLLASPGLASDLAKKICGIDEREPSNFAPVARLVQSPGNFGCTGTLIGVNCVISAGHCGSFFRYAEFNVPMSTEKGKPVAAAEEDRYPVEEVLGRSNGGDGRDWAVIRLGPNPITGELPGRRQGFLEVSFDPPHENTFVRITGYGTDSKRPTHTGAQQTATGYITGVHESSATLSYSVDTEPGNSGASIVDETTGKVIGVHTTGYCSGSGGSNVGTSIAFREEFRKAIEDCLGQSGD